MNNNTPIANQIATAACPDAGLVNFKRTLTLAFMVEAKFTATQAAEIVDAILAMYKNAEFTARSSCDQKWKRLQLLNPRLTALIEAAYQQEPTYTAPCGKSSQEKRACLFLWLPILLKHRAEGTLEKKRSECLTKADSKWRNQKSKAVEIVEKLQNAQGVSFPQWSQAEQQDLLKQVLAVPLTPYDMVRGARRAQSVLLFPLIDKSGLQHIFTQLRKPNVWVQKERKPRTSSKVAGDKRKRGSDDEAPRTTKKAKTTTTPSDELDDDITNEILDQVDRSQPQTPTQSPAHAPMSPADHQGQFMMPPAVTAAAPIAPVADEKSFFDFDPFEESAVLSSDDTFGLPSLEFPFSTHLASTPLTQPSDDFCIDTFSPMPQDFSYAPFF